MDPDLAAELSKDVSLRFRLRFVDAPAPVDQPSLRMRQDRRFNEIEEVSAFLSPSALLVEGATYACCDAANPHGGVLLEILDPDATAAGSSGRVRVPFRYRSAVDILWAAWEEGAGSGGGGGGGAASTSTATATTAGASSFVTSELTEQRELLPGEAEPIQTTFFELLWRFERPPSASGGATATAAQQRPAQQPLPLGSVVHARYRVAQYLSLPGLPPAPPPLGAPAGGKAMRALLERDAAGRAVAIIDYDLRMERVGDAAPAGDAAASAADSKWRIVRLP